MFKNLTYHQKNKFMLVGAALFLLLAWALSLSTTKDMIVRHYQLQDEVERSKNAPAQILQYQEELLKIEEIFGNNTDDEFKFQDTLLAFVTPFCEHNNMLLRAFPAPHKMASSGLEVQTTVFVVEGSFSNLLQVVYQLEQKHKIGRMAAVDFVSEENKKTKELRLQARLFVQNFKKLNP